MDLVAMRRAHRERNVALLAQSGFTPQPWLPLREHRVELRPTIEIVRRSMAVGAMLAWVEETHDAGAIEAHVARSGLLAELSADERALFAMDRAAARDADAISVPALFDGLWSLAWVLGHDPAPAFDGRRAPPEVEASVRAFAQRGLDAAADAVADRVTLRSLADVVVVEDLFYCVHNAARHAAFGQATARPAFDPDEQGPAIEARRQGLTWVLSPSVAWHDTELDS